MCCQEVLFELKQPIHGRIPIIEVSKILTIGIACRSLSVFLLFKRIQKFLLNC